MTTKVASRSLVQLACAALIAGGLAACGGGGGGGGAVSQPESASPTLVITAANSDTVGHFTAVAALSLPISWLSETSVSLTGGNALGAPTGGRFALLTLRDRLTQAGTGRSHALDALESGDLPCNFGGTMSVTLDDRDNNLVESPGDVETAQFKGCMPAANETYDGTWRLVVVSTSIDAPMYDSTVQLSYTTPKHTLKFDGSYEATSDSMYRTTVTVKGSMSVTVATHAGYADTVTFADGFVVVDQIDYGAARNVLTVAGRVASASAGGSVDLSTPNELVTSRNGYAGGYPETGTVKAQGKVGALSVRAVSSASVCLDTDDNDDGHVESTSTQSWDWLL